MTAAAHSFSTAAEQARVAELLAARIAEAPAPTEDQADLIQRAAETARVAS